MSRSKNNRANKLTKTKRKLEDKPERRSERKLETNNQVRKRNRMENAIYIIGIAATIICLLAGYFASFHSNLRTPSIWLLFSGLILYSLGLCLYLQNWIWKEDVVLLQPSIQLPTEDTKPILKQPTFREKVKDVTFTFGGNSFLYSISDLEQFPHPLPIMQKFLTNENQLIIYVKDNKPFVDVRIYGDTQYQVVEIKQNEFTKPPNWDSNSNENALEIVNQKQEPVFQLY
jgi:hypothetical protein